MAPKCVASTGPDFCEPIQHHDRIPASAHGQAHHPRSNLFREAQVSLNGSYVIAHNEDQCLRTFALPSELPVDGETPSTLKPCAQYQSPTNIQSFAVSPWYDGQDQYTAIVFCSSSDVPISARNFLDYDNVWGAYPFVDPLNERHLPARSLLVTPHAGGLVAGTDGSFAIFDMLRPGEGPTSHYRFSNRSSKARRRHGWAMRSGLVMAMDVSSDQTLAIGTTGRQVGLFDFRAQDPSAIFSVDEPFTTGTGVCALRWTSCGRYLFIRERRDDKISMYDIRVAGKLIAALSCPSSSTNQRLDFDLVSTETGTDVWAGGSDGQVSQWRHPTASSGLILPDASFALHQAPVPNVVWNGVSNRLITCSGEHFPFPTFSDHDDEQPNDPDNTLKVWQFDDTEGLRV